MDATALVLNWNGLAATRACVAALKAQTDVSLRIVVVDNGSTDGSAAALTADGVEVLALDGNYGFAGGMNRGAAHAGPGPLLLVNNDALLAPDAVRKLQDALEAAPQAVLAAPTIYLGHPPARDRVWYAGGQVGRYTAVVTHGARPIQTTRPTPFASGCCLLFRAGAYEAYGGLDEAYFLYFEDAALCERIHAAGRQILYVGAAEAWHDAGASTGSQRAKAAALDYYDVRNGIFFIRGYRHGLARALAWAYLLGVRLPRKLVRLLAVGKGRRAGLGAIAHGLKDGIAGQDGPLKPSRIPQEATPEALD